VKKASAFVLTAVIVLSLATWWYFYVKGNPLTGPEKLRMRQFEASLNKQHHAVMVYNLEEYLCLKTAQTIILRMFQN